MLHKGGPGEAWLDRDVRPRHPGMSPPVRWHSKDRGDLESEAKGGQVSI